MRAFLTCLLCVAAPALLPNVALASSPEFAATFKPFQSDAELLEFLKSPEDETRTRTSKPPSLIGGALGDADGISGMPKGLSGGGGGSHVAKKESAQTDPKPTNAAITHNQVQGVDEGGLVKNIGNSLVVLRQGRLYAVDVTTRGQARLTDSIRVALDENLNQGVSYNELLVKGDLIYIVGDRNAARLLGAGDQPLKGEIDATEFSSFRLKNGKLERLKTLFIESSGHGSSEDFTSRLLDDRLVAYMPFFLGPQPDRITYPKIFTYAGPRQDGLQAFKPAGRLFSAKDVYKPDSVPFSASFQTIVSCQLPDDGSLNCQAKAILEGEPSGIYVSENNAYLWGQNRVVAFDLKTLKAATHRAEGYVEDTFAFSEKNGTLRVATVTNDGAQILRLPLKEFADHAKQPSLHAVPLQSGNVETMQHRWVDDWFLAGLNVDNDNHLLAYNDKNMKVQDLDLEGWVQAIDAMPGVGALFSIQGPEGLILKTAQLQDTLTLIPAHELKDVEIHELRSHGFFFKSNPHGGIFALPIVQDTAHWQANSFIGDTVSAISFFGVQKSGVISPIGIIRASEDADSVCEASCVDGYGNTRPVFLGDRIFALMGSEISEASITERSPEAQAPKHAGPNYHLTEHGKRVALTFERANGQGGE